MKVSQTSTPHLDVERGEYSLEEYEEERHFPVSLDKITRRLYRKWYTVWRWKQPSAGLRQSKCQADRRP
jgi:hypothetical protein